MNAGNEPILVIDGHIDTIIKRREEHRELSVESPRGHVDMPRLKRANVQACLFSLCPMKNAWLVSKYTRYWFHDVNDEQNGLLHVRNIDDFERARATGKIGAILHYEGAAHVDRAFKRLDDAACIGVRAMCITHKDQNRFASGAKFKGTQRPGGLTTLGKDLVPQVENRGIVIDVSHLNDPSFWDVIKIARKPFIASHSNCRAICDHPRNLTDDQIRAIRDVNGTIGINFSGMFLVSGWKQNRIPLTYEHLKQHIDHIVDVAGIDTVAIGSDYDGTVVPDGLKDCTKLPGLFTYLVQEGYSRVDVQKIARENLLRVFKATWT